MVKTDLGGAYRIERDLRSRSFGGYAPSRLSLDQRRRHLDPDQQRHAIQLDLRGGGDPQRVWGDPFRGRAASTDNGATWTVVDNGLTSLGVYALATAPNASGGTDLVAGTGEGVSRTSDNGDHWTNVSFVYSQVAGLEVTPSGAILAGTPAAAFTCTGSRRAVRAGLAR